MSTVSNVQSRIAGLADNSQVISGVAIGIGDITNGLEGELKYWPREELRAAAASLEGQEINALHSQQTVGEVTRAGFDPNRGVIYEAELEDAKLAENIGRGSFEVSIEAKHADGGTVDTDSGEAMLASDIRFTGMAIVQHGAAPSASAQPGEAAALSPADIGDRLDRTVLAEVNGTEVDLTPPESVVNAAEAAQEAKAEYDDLSDCGTGVGDTRAEQIATGDLAPADFTTGGQAETAIPDYLDSHADDVENIDEPPTEWDEETWTDGCGPVQYALWGGTATGEGLEWAQSTADAVETAMEESEAAADVSEEYIFDNPGEAVEKAQDMGLEGAGDEIIHTRESGGETVFMPAPSHEALLDLLEESDAAGTDDAVSPERGQAEVSTGGEPGGRTDTETTDSSPTMGENESNDDELSAKLQETKAELQEKEERIAELEDTVEQYEEERADVARAYAEALAAGDTIFDEDDLVEKFTIAELAERFESTDEATLADVEPDVQSGGNENTEEATLSDAEQAEVDEHREAIAALAGSESSVAKHERLRRAELVAEMTGEDPDTILEEANE